MKQLKGTDLKRFNRHQDYPDLELVGLLENIEYAINVGSIFRIADALRFKKLLLYGITPTPPNKSLSKVARGKEKRVPWAPVKDLAATISSLKTEGFAVYALEITDQSLLYDRPEYPAKVALVCGHEEFGITKATLALCDKAIYLPVFGKGRSLNVHVSFAVASYYIIHQKMNSLLNNPLI